MGPVMVVMLDPLPNDDLGFFNAIKDFSTKEVVSKGAIKAFTKAIFPGAARFNISGFNPSAG
jgi:hypothetical protein